MPMKYIRYGVELSENDIYEMFYKKRDSLYKSYQEMNKMIEEKKSVEELAKLLQTYEELTILKD
jgi:hypothetical protein